MKCGKYVEDTFLDTDEVSKMLMQVAKQINNLAEKQRNGK